MSQNKTEFERAQSSYKRQTKTLGKLEIPIPEMTSSRLSSKSDERKIEKRGTVHCYPTSSKDGPLPRGRSDTANRNSSRLSTGFTLRSRTQPVSVPKLSHRMEPYREFSVHDVRAIIKDVVELLFRDASYDAETIKMLAQSACERIKEEVKLLRYPRYKLVCLVYVAENLKQGIHISSMSMLDANYDNYAEYVKKCRDYNVTAVVHGFYTH